MKPLSPITWTIVKGTWKAVSKRIGKWRLGTVAYACTTELQKGRQEDWKFKSILAGTVDPWLENWLPLGRRQRLSEGQRWWDKRKGRWRWKLYPIPYSWRLCLEILFYRLRTPEAQERKLINEYAPSHLEKECYRCILGQKCFSSCEKTDHFSVFWLTSSTEINLRDQEFLPGKEISLEYNSMKTW